MQVGLHSILAFSHVDPKALTLRFASMSFFYSSSALLYVLPLFLPHWAALHGTALVYLHLHVGIYYKNRP